MKNRFPTDEDRLIYHLTVHKTMIGWLLDQFQAEGIDAKRTIGNNPNGDIVLGNSKKINLPNVMPECCYRASICMQNVDSR
ncbi:hypothetical protein QUF64_10775 [Anaerolineales bacterium HSG6]|nr:hypothetical protein [Anaerolineales bacterium HSG6]